MTCSTVEAVKFAIFAGVTIPTVIIERVLCEVCLAKYYSLGIVSQILQNDTAVTQYTITG